MAAGTRTEHDEVVDLLLARWRGTASCELREAFGRLGPGQLVDRVSQRVDLRHPFGLGQASHSSGRWCGDDRGERHAQSQHRDRCDAGS